MKSLIVLSMGLGVTRTQKALPAQALSRYIKRINHMAQSLSHYPVLNSLHAGSDLAALLQTLAVCLSTAGIYLAWHM